MQKCKPHLTYTQLSPLWGKLGRVAKINFHVVNSVITQLKRVRGSRVYDRVFKKNIGIEIPTEKVDHILNAFENRKIKSLLSHQYPLKNSDNQSSRCQLED